MAASEPSEGAPASVVPPSVSRAQARARRYVLAPQDPARAAELGRALGLSPLMGQVLLNRGFGDEDQGKRFLAPKLAELTSPAAMVDRARAAARLAEAVKRRERIVVFGDYDVDGTTSTAILSDILEALGGDVHALVAHRFEGGYGLSDAALARVLALSPRVLVTCDCGSSDHARVRRATEAGVDVIVVDHHLVPAEPLPALAFLNPHRPDCGFGYKGLCSAGLALSLGAAVRAELGVELDLRRWLDLVALGTIADVAPLFGDNRSLVRAGLAMLTTEQARPGVVALREAAKVRSGTRLGAIDVAFRLTPRLNAAGRLGDPALTLALLRAKSLEEARGLAVQIERLNSERKEIERRVTEEALAQLSDEAARRSGLVAASRAFHRGVVGISAARLVDWFGLPSLVAAVDGDHAHGSARAPAGFPLFEAIRRSSRLFDKFGGHDAAAGFSLPAGRIDELRDVFDQACAELMRERELGPTEVRVDASLDGADGQLPSATQLALFEPLGAGNPEPLFVVTAVATRADVVGEEHLKLSLRCGAEELRGFGFAMGARAASLPGRPLRVYGHLRPDTYRGGESVELRLVELEPLG